MIYGFILARFHVLTRLVVTISLGSLRGVSERIKQEFQLIIYNLQSNRAPNLLTSAPIVFVF